MTTAKIKSPYAHAQYFAALDGFRGLLALLVAIYHTIWLSHINSTRFLDNGAIIIDVFFAFSGFLMFTLYANKLRDRGEIRSFMVRRFARLYPLHLFMLAVFLAFALFRLWAHKTGLASIDPGEVLPFEAGAPENMRSLIAHLTLTHAMGGADSLTFNPPSWTIGAEFYTYFVFIGFALLMAGRKFGAGVAALLCVGITAIYAVLAYLKPNLDVTYDLGFLRCIGGFFIGVLAARLFQAKPSHLIEKHATSLEVGLLTVCVLFIIYCDGKLQFLAGPLLFAFVYLFAHDGGAVSRFMSQRVFTYLAKISYSVYMIHVIIAIVFAVGAEQVLGRILPGWNMDGWGGDLLLIPYLATVIAASHLTYHFVEVPGGRIIRRWFKRSSDPAKLLKGPA